MVSVRDDLCTGCGACIDACPVAAIHMVEGKAQIDKALCTECGICIPSCPQEAIEQEFSKDQSGALRTLSGRGRRFSGFRRGRRRRGKRR